MRALMAQGLPLTGLPEHGIPRVPLLGHAMQTAILEQQLTLGSSIVLECIMTHEIIRTWMSMCCGHDANIVTVECICSDRELHRQRVERRYLAGESQITWEMASRAPVTYRTIPGADYLADAVYPVDTHVSAIAALLEQA